MASQYASPFRNRVYQRRFDHEQAARRYRAGETIQKLADEYGVSYTAVYRVVVPGERARMDLRRKEYMRRHRSVCADCGSPCDARVVRCRACYNQRRRTQNGINADGSLTCTRCRHDLPADLFTHDAHYPDRGFRRTFCRACDTATRRERRQRHIPCDAVGVASGQEAAPLAPRQKGPDESVSQPSSPLPRRPC